MSIKQLYFGIYNLFSRNLISFVTLKFLVVILSFYVFALAIRPCDHRHASDSLKSIEHSDSDKDADSDCSPFCVCACSGTLDLTRVYQFGLPKTEIIPSVLNFPFSENLHGDFMPSFWQPPKL